MTAWAIKQEIQDALNREFRIAQTVGYWSAIVLIAAALARRLMPRYEDRLRRTTLSIRIPELSRPVHIRLGTTDRIVLKQVMKDDEYAPVANLASIRSIVDCGANIGLTSAYLLDRYPYCTLLAIEAEAGNAELCRRNLAPYSDRASVLRAGVWRNGTWEQMTPLVLDRSFGDGREWAFSVQEAMPGVSPDVLGIGLASVNSRLNGIDLLKIDIEGGEAVLFSPGCETWLPEVRNIAIELHGPECSSIFFEALREYEFDLLRKGELTFALNLRRRS